MFCPECGTPNDNASFKCTRCGTSLREGAAPSQQQRPAYGPPTVQHHQAAPPPYQQYQQVNLQMNGGMQGQGQSESYAFAIVTLILYLVGVLWPVGVICNIVGVFTGPHRGCFGAMLVVFLGLPFITFVLFMIAAILAPATSSMP